MSDEGGPMPDRAALLVIDVQQGLIEGFEEDWAAVLPVIVGQVQRAHDGGAPIVFIQHCGAGDRHPLRPDLPGFALHGELEVWPEDLRVRKTWSDAFAETDLDHKLRRSGARRLVVTGAQTEYCVDATVRRAASLGYDVDLVTDGHTTSENGLLTREQIVAHHNLTLPNLACPGARIRALPAEEIDWSHLAP